ncbi:hypothetical protein ACQW02_27085 [Humitalea sp. 24SJ18S-53]|uniref:hypothetical protein n=1 Tax=Humitalea sp. 24SJ18S-53 TaxID=3422307 RepID=UPI003D678B51
MPNMPPPVARPLPYMVGPAPRPANDLGRPDERKEGGPDFGRAAKQAEHAEKARRDAAAPPPDAPKP